MLRAAVLGTGQPALYHLDAYRRHPGVELAAVWGRSAERVRALGQEFGVRLATTEIDKIWDNPSIDLVSVCLPNHLHAEWCTRAMRAGKHVLCEVPMVSQGADGEALAQVVKETGRKLYVGQLDRVEAPFVAIKRLLDDGELGRPVLIESTFYGGGSWTGSQPADWWGFDARNPEVVLFSLGCFPVSLLRWVGGPIAEVQAYARPAAETPGHYYDTVIANLRFASGALGRMVITEGVARPYSIDLAVNGERGSMVNNQLFLARLADLSRPEFVGLPIPLITWQNYPDHAVQRLFDTEVAQFIECVLEDGSPAVDVHEGLAIIRTLEAIARSASSGRPEAVA